MKLLQGKRCVLIVAHPDDEVLWAGGLVLLNKENDWTVISLCRKSDPDRAPKFFKSLDKLGAVGKIGDLNDEAGQSDLDPVLIEKTVMDLLPDNQYDLIITHNAEGEYTRHKRHEEVSHAVTRLIKEGKLKTKQYWQFAYEDGKGEYLPRAMPGCDIKIKLKEAAWKEKYNIITNIYGFAESSFEARTTPKTEASMRIKV